MIKLTANDKRVLRAIAEAEQHYDGFAPHGAANWVAIKRLVKWNLVFYADFGTCETCDLRHETAIYKIGMPAALEYL